MTESPHSKPLDSLKARIKMLRAETSEKPTERESTSGASMAMRLGTELVAGVAVGGVIGYFLDEWLGTIPLFLILCLMLGMAAGFLNMYRTNQRFVEEMEKENQDSK